MKKILIISLIGITGFLTGCNRTLLDTQWNFTKAKIIIGNEVIDVEVSKWSDYDDTSVQITDINGKTYLTDLKNVVLINE